MPEPGWYEDPADGARLRYWDGATWGPVKDRSRIADAGAKVQAVGDGIAKTGMAVVWIVVGIVALGFIFLLL
jgi:hypothetical protein